jgi:uncharacterized membrane-anchored protein YjiN (DUF445 family)
LLAVQVSVFRIVGTVLGGFIGFLLYILGNALFGGFG